MTMVITRKQPLIVLLLRQQLQAHLQNQDTIIYYSTLFLPISSLASDEINVNGTERFLDPSSIQHQALEWIANNVDSTALPLYDETSSETEFGYLSQLYALCLLRLAMTNVGRNVNWMEPSPTIDFCAWNGVECIDGTNSVQKLILCKYTEVLVYVYLVSLL